jgi:MFS family permease
VSTAVPVTRRGVLGVPILSLGFGDQRCAHGREGVAALTMGNLADRLGQRRVLVGALVVFSILIGGSGLATSLLGLVLVRIMMGFEDGAFTPASITATIQMSPPERDGRNVGRQQTMLVLFGLGLSPLLVAALLSHGIDWRYFFSLFLIPGLLVAWQTWRIISCAGTSGTRHTKQFRGLARGHALS